MTKKKEKNKRISKIDDFDDPPWDVSDPISDVSFPLNETRSYKLVSLRDLYNLISENKQ